MAQSFTNEDGVTLVIPGTYVTQKVIAGQGGIAAAGVVTLIGEADEGPDWSKEASLDENSFTPDEIAAVIQKYGSGRIVDAFRTIVAAANDPAIVGAVSEVKIVKTNPSATAESEISRSGFGAFADVFARRAGQPGNLIKYRSEVAQAEAIPTTIQFAYTPHYSGTPVSFKLRANGGDSINAAIAARYEGPDFASDLTDLAKGILAKGGDEVLPLTGKAGLAISLAVIGAAADGIIEVALASGQTFASVPAVGDSMVIPLNGEYSNVADSAIKGAGSENAASYVVQSVTNTITSAKIRAKRINTASVSDVLAASGVVDAGERDIVCYKKVQITNYTGMNRQSSIGLVGPFSWNISLNDGANVIIELPGTHQWASQPAVGDYARFDAVFGTVQAGLYLVTASTIRTVALARISNGTSGSGSMLVSQPAGPITSEPFLILKPVIDGLGKSLEVSGIVSSIAKDPNTAAAVSFSNSLLLAAAEYRNAFTISRGTTSDTFVSGGDVVVTFGCTEDDAEMVIDDEKIDFKVATVSQFQAAFKDYQTLQDLADYVASQTNWSASVTSPKYAFVAPSALDQGSFGATADASRKPARIKRDATAWQTATSGGGLARTALKSQSGMPELIIPDQFLAGGAKNGTTSADFVTAMDALESVTTNFIVPLISKDASEDIGEGDTETSSTYTVDAVNAYTKSHVLKMSALKARKNRVAIVSKSGAYEDQKDAAGEMSSYRVGMTFQDVKVLGGDGTIQQFQPWMAAVVAAGMQAAAGYKGIVKKQANITGVVKEEGDFSSAIPGNLEDALKAGLLILERIPTGGFRWVSDQMTYSIDNNFVYNSLQAVYIADLMALTLIQNFDRAIVGGSVAEISAQGALSFLDSEMFNFRRLKWIAPSDDAPKGYKNASVKITGGVMQVYVEVKLAGLIYFVPITMAISQVTQEASQ